MSWNNSKYFHKKFKRLALTTKNDVLQEAKKLRTASLSSASSSVSPPPPAPPPSRANQHEQQQQQQRQQSLLPTPAYKNIANSVAFSYHESQQTINDEQHPPTSNNINSYKQNQQHVFVSSNSVEISHNNNTNSPANVSSGGVTTLTASSSTAGGGGGRYKCPYCDTSCTNPSVLPYPCEICGIAYKTKSNVDKHCRSHLHVARQKGSEVSSETYDGLSDQDVDAELSHSSSEMISHTGSGSPTDELNNTTIKKHQIQAQQHYGTQNEPEEFMSTSNNSVPISPDPLKATKPTYLQQPAQQPPQIMPLGTGSPSSSDELNSTTITQHHPIDELNTTTITQQQTQAQQYYGAQNEPEVFMCTSNNSVPISPDPLKATRPTYLQQPAQQPPQIMPLGTGPPSPIDELNTTTITQQQTQAQQYYGTQNEPEVFMSTSNNSVPISPHPLTTTNPIYLQQPAQQLRQIMPLRPPVVETLSPVATAKTVEIEATNNTATTSSSTQKSPVGRKLYKPKFHASLYATPEEPAPAASANLPQSPCTITNRNQPLVVAIDRRILMTPSVRHFQEIQSRGRRLLRPPPGVSPLVFMPVHNITPELQQRFRHPIEFIQQQTQRYQQQYHLQQQHLLNKKRYIQSIST